MFSEDSPDWLTIQATAVLLTGLVKAFDLHADTNTNPQQAMILRDHADEVRSQRDDLLKILGLVPGTELRDHGGHSEWTGAIGKLTADDVTWPMRPSRDPWSAVGE